MTRIIDFDAHSYSGTDQNSTEFWAIWNGKDYRISMESLQIGLSVGATLVKSSAQSPATGATIEWDIVHTAAGSYWNSASKGLIVIPNDKITKASIHVQVELVDIAHGQQLAVKKNGTEVLSAAAAADMLTVSYGRMYNLKTQPLDVSSGDFFEVIYKGGASGTIVNSPYNNWVSIVPEVFA